MSDQILGNGGTQPFDKNQLALSIQNSGVEETTAINLASRVEGDVVANGGNVSPRAQPTRLTSDTELDFEPIEAPRTRGNISSAFGDLVSAETSVVTKAAPYIRCFAEPSGRTKFRVEVPGDPSSIGLRNGDLQVIKDRVADTNALIDLGALGVDQFGNLTFLDGWQRKVDEYYLGTALAVTSPVAGIVSVNLKTVNLPNGGVITINLGPTGFIYCFDDKATDRVKELLTLGTVASGLASELGIPAAVALGLFAARLLIGAADLFSDFFARGGFYLNMPGGGIAPRLF